MFFDINKYSGKYAMHCRTQEEATHFCNYLHKHGRRWVSGTSYLSNTEYSEHYAYKFNRGEIAPIVWLQRNNYTILEWSDFMNDAFAEEMTLAEVCKLLGKEIKIIK